METTKELYQRAKLTSGVRSDYEFAKKFEQKTPTVSRWANGKATFDDESADLIADILGEEAEYIMACAHAERAKSEKAKRHWARIAAAFAVAALPPAANAFAGASFDNNALNASFIFTCISNYTLSKVRQIKARLAFINPSLQLA